ncbi:MAG: hypothetical protein GX916_05785, partial [Clostridiales bacterium]|nr:hypothetical protein [Clostridiales bacterium]
MKKALIYCLVCVLLLGWSNVQADTVSLAWRTAALYVPASAMPESLQETDEGLLIL